MTEVLLLAALLVADTGVAGTGAYREWERERSVQVLQLTRDEIRDSWLGEDKFKHFAFSYAVTAGTAAGARLFTDNDASVITGAALGVAAGVAKEIYDRRNRGGASLRDLLWDLAGVGAGVLIMQQAR